MPAGIRMSLILALLLNRVKDGANCRQLLSACAPSKECGVPENRIDACKD